MAILRTLIQKKQNFKSELKTSNIDLENILLNNNYIHKKKDQYLDFGGFLKGWTTQKMSKMCYDVSGSIINLGGDIVVQGRDLNTTNFHLVIGNPINTKKDFHVQLKNEALATSGTYKRQWKR